MQTRSYKLKHKVPTDGVVQAPLEARTARAANTALHMQTNTNARGEYPDPLTSCPQGTHRMVGQISGPHIPASIDTNQQLCPPHRHVCGPACIWFPIGPTPQSSRLPMMLTRTSVPNDTAPDQSATSPIICYLSLPDHDPSVLPLLPPVSRPPPSPVTLAACGFSSSAAAAVVSCGCCTSAAEGTAASACCPLRCVCRDADAGCPCLLADLIRRLLCIL